MSTENFGRPQKVSREDVLKAIRDLKTKSATKIAKHYNVNRASVYRRFSGDDKEPPITDKEINEALGLVTEQELEPLFKGKEGFDKFFELPLIKEYRDAMLYNRNMRKGGERTHARMLWRICKFLGKKPSALTPEDVSSLHKRLLKNDPDVVKEFRGGGYSVRMSARSWFGFRGVGGQRLTGLGLGSDLYKRNKLRAQIKLSKEQRARIMDEIHKRIGENWVGGAKDRVKLQFKDNPNLAAAIEIYPKIAYYTGVRADSTFNSCWELDQYPDDRGHAAKYSGVTVGFSRPLDDYKKGEEIVFRHLDKGKRGGIKWDKRLYGQFADEFYNYWVRLGKPKSGLIFCGLQDWQVREFLKECYEAAAIPEMIYKSEPTERGVNTHAMPLHIWRHTAAQDLLEATEWNADLGATQLGWETTQVLKDNYGKIPPDVQRRLVMKAQGIEVPEEKKYFVF